jgi:hypothetical protein
MNSICETLDDDLRVETTWVDNKIDFHRMVVLYHMNTSAALNSAQ